MAINDKDKPKNHTLGARLGKTVYPLGESLPVIYGKECLKSIGDGFDEGAQNIMNIPATLLMIVAPLAYGFIQLPFLSDENVVLPHVDSGYSFDAELDENGYIAISSDKGQTGYALFREDETYRLYSFSNRETLKGQIILKLEDEKDRAWYVSRSVHQDFKALLSATQSTDVAFTAPQWEAYSFENVTNFVKRDNDDIWRFAGAMKSQDEVYATIPQQYETLGNAWLEATNAMLDGRTGFTQSEIGQRAGELTLETTYFSDGNWDNQLLGGMFGLGGLIIAMTSIGPALNRRREIKGLRKTSPKP